MGKDEKIKELEYRIKRLEKLLLAIHRGHNIPIALPSSYFEDKKVMEYCNDKMKPVREFNKLIEELEKEDNRL